MRCSISETAQLAPERIFSRLDEMGPFQSKLREPGGPGTDITL
jgi:hypothetical protein